ncbi:MAG: hypothetical protein KDD66_00315, partial [Bdellovibrionales bacterium]|nr:hypothetical protein [Bdellovibrionales bacterium]
MISKLLQNGLLWHAASHSVHTAAQTAVFGLSEIDGKLPERGLCLGAVHEWCLEQELSSHRKTFWSAPLLLLSSLIAHNMRCSPLLSGKNIAWVGRRCWPTPALLNAAFNQTQDFNWRTNSLFIHPANTEESLWSACEILRSPCIGAAVIDGSSFNAAASRRLQLHARKSSVLGLLVKQPWKIGSSSAAHTKWKITTTPSPTANPRWRIELLRCRGAPESSSWLIEYNPRTTSEAIKAHRENIHLYLPADMVDRPNS